LEAIMKKPITALVAAGALGLSLVSTTQPASAMDPWTAAAWFVGGMFVAGAIAPAYGYSYGQPYGYRGGYAYAGGYPGTYAYAGPQAACYPATIRRHGQWRNVRVCY
jgi:hypothetical protein